MLVASSAETAWSHLRVRYGRWFPHLLFFTREAVSVFVVMAATLAASLDGDYLSEVISGGRIAG
jgi:hypothetical protein